MAPVPAKADSVYDFLYIDLPRVQIFNSQFSQYGHITELTRSTTTSSSIGGGIDLKVLKSDSSEGEQTEIAKRYDTQFVAPLLFLDNAKNMIVRDLANAGIGQFVLASGNVSILDLKMLKNAWDLKGVKKLATMGAQQTQVAQTSQNRQQRRQAQSNPASSPSATIEFMFELLGIMPHGIQAQALCGDNQVWSALNVEFFITPPADLSLNHGSHLPGIWNLVGILDAVPDDLAAPAGPADSEHSLVGNLTTTIQPLVRQMLGRPTGSYGLTPLLIFREVGS